MLIIELTPNQTLRGVQSVLWVCDCLPLRRQTNETLAIRGETNDGRRCVHTFGILDNFGRLALHDGNTAVCRAEVNADNLGAELSRCGHVRVFRGIYLQNQ